MGKKKECFGDEHYACRTKDCPYMAECVQVVWQKKMSRILTRPKPARGARKPVEVPVRGR